MVAAAGLVCDVADMTSLLSVAQRINGKFDDALRSAEEGLRLTRAKGEPVREARDACESSAD